MAESFSFPIALAIIILGIILIFLIISYLNHSIKFQFNVPSNIIYLTIIQIILVLIFDSKSIKVKMILAVEAKLNNSKL